MTRSRHSPYIHAPWIAKALVGDRSCLWATWFKANHERYAKVPSGFDSDGMPTGIQFMARAYDENICIALGRVYQERTDWHEQHPADLVTAGSE